jgi:hypothetical protein
MNGIKPAKMEFYPIHTPFLAMEMIFQLTCFALAIISMICMASWKIHDLLRGFSRRTKQQRGQFLGF